MITIGQQQLTITAQTMIICILAPVALCLLITSLRKMISVSFMVRSSSLLQEEK